jgi:hypothetical protein
MEPDKRPPIPRTAQEYAAARRGVAGIIAAEYNLDPAGPVDQPRARQAAADYLLLVAMLGLPAARPTVPARPGATGVCAYRGLTGGAR